MTGGAGFIGSHVVDLLLNNHTITIYDNLSNSSKSTINSSIKKGVQFIKGDILDYEMLVKYSKGFDLVIHLAAKTDVTESVIHQEKIEKINVNGTINVVRCCIENNVKKIIFSSSAAVYGDSKVSTTENTKTNPLSPYGISKLLAENKIKRMAENKIEYVILRLFNVYGKRQNKQHTDVISNFIENISKDKPFVIYGNGEQVRDFISIKDVVNAFHCAIKINSNGIYNIATGKSISINELSKIFLDMSRKKINIKYESAKKADIKYSKADITLAKKELGFKPKINLKYGLLDLISISN
ncbi:NAD-dependent epimerase/dehydratase family protein [Nitrosopumilus sp.]|uniref:NAD-dependent epimerase/dehydratase family protein n=1 Tax=Nitrosopumilus sp. TaxID=2024843 RepID=UPI002930CA50|nr:NAD-dependent epimerase/dehydratase family protein [Nitrosopumilus sp.]